MGKMNQSAGRLIFARVMFIVSTIAASGSFSLYSYQYYVLHTTEGFCSLFFIFFPSAIFAYISLLLLRANKKKKEMEG